MEKLTYTSLERYGELAREAEGCINGILNAMHGAYPDNSESPRGMDAKAYAVELRSIAIDLEREIRRLDKMTELDAASELGAAYGAAIAQEAGLVDPETLNVLHRVDPETGDVTNTWHREGDNWVAV